MSNKASLLTVFVAIEGRLLSHEPLPRFRRTTSSDFVTVLIEYHSLCITPWTCSLAQTIF